jgi:hypothetical protein
MLEIDATGVLEDSGDSRRPRPPGQFEQPQSARIGKQLDVQYIVVNLPCVHDGPYEGRSLVTQRSVINREGRQRDSTAADVTWAFVSGDLNEGLAFYDEDISVNYRMWRSSLNDVAFRML